MGQFRNNQLLLFSSFGISPTLNSKLEFKATHVRNYFHLEGGLDNWYGVENVTSNSYTLEGSFKINTLNHPVFPSKGVHLNVIYRMILKQSSSHSTEDGLFKPIAEDNDLVIIDYKQFIRVAQRVSIIPEFTLGYMNSIPFYADKFFLGGNDFNSRINTFNHAGVLPFHIATDNFIKVGLGVQLMLLDNWYVNSSYQSSMFINNSETFSEQSLELESESISGWAAGLSYNSMFGPLKFTLSQNLDNRKFYYYLSLGFPF